MAEKPLARGMDGFLGPYKLGPRPNTFKAARAPILPSPWIEDLDDLTLGPDLRSVKGKSLLDLVDPENHSEKARAERLDSVFYKTKPAYNLNDFNETVAAPDDISKRSDFRNLARDDRGSATGEWLTDDIFTPEIRKLQKKIDEESLEIYITPIDESVLLSDSRIEIAERYILPDEMLAKQFWVIPQINVQREGNTLKSFTLTVSTLEGKDGKTASFEIESLEAEKDGRAFLDKVEGLIEKKEDHKFIWWIVGTEKGFDKDDPQQKNVVNDAAPRVSTLSILRRAGYPKDVGKELGKRYVWVGSNGPTTSHPLRKARRVRQYNPNHWWVTIINSYTGEVCIHNSLGKLGIEKVNILLENLEWLLNARKSRDSEWERILALRKCPLATEFEDRTDKMRYPARQQENGSDCGIFALIAIETFVAKSGRLKDQQTNKTYRSNLVEKSVSIEERRARLQKETPLPVSLVFTPVSTLFIKYIC